MRREPSTRSVRSIVAVAVSSLALISACGDDDGGAGNDTTPPAGTASMSTEPMSTEPISTEPMSTEPMSTEPMATEPMSTEPIGTEQGSGQQNGAMEVTIVDFAFEPGDVEIAAGETVTWTNEDSATHTVESDDGTLDSGDLAQGDTYEMTFDEPGTYEYVCGIHPNMEGTVTVTA